MKRIYDSTRASELFVRAGLIAAIAATLLLPMSINANGMDTASRGDKAAPQLKQGSRDALPLPPIPHLESMPWLAGERPQRTLKIDTLLPPPEDRPALAGTGHRSLHALSGSIFLRRNPGANG